MAGFRKAKAEQAAIKMGMYGPPGSGKTFTALLCAEGLANQAKRRIAFVDTERGTDFYCKPVPERKAHPDAFDFDALYTRSLTETLDAVRSIKPSEYCVVVIDSITHLWEAARAAYDGKETKVGTIPFHAWGKIKKPYKALMNYLLSCPLHVFILGRQSNEFAEDEDTGETKQIGVKMKAEGETPYEPHILLRLECEKDKTGSGVIKAFAEKDRTGVLAGKTIFWPGFKNLIGPILPLLGANQAKIEDEDSVARKDAEAIQAHEAKKEEESAKSLRRFKARLELCESEEEVKAVAKEITPQVKAAMIPAHVTELREFWDAALKRAASGQPNREPTGDDMPPLNVAEHAPPVVNEPEERQESPETNPQVETDSEVEFDCKTLLKSFYKSSKLKGARQQLIQDAVWKADKQWHIRREILRELVKLIKSNGEPSEDSSLLGLVSDAIELVTAVEAGAKGAQ